MNADEELEARRERFGFVGIVRQQFAFLSTLGFSEVESSPMVVRYRKGELDLTVYHERLSYEVGMSVGRENEKFSIGQLIRAIDPDAGAKFRDPMASTKERVISAVEHVVELIHRYGGRALQDDPEFFADLTAKTRSWVRDFALDTIAVQIRPKAEAAFRERRYREAAELYERIATCLTATEKAKFAAAKKRS